MERLAAIDWTNSISVVEEMADIFGPLRAMLVDAWSIDGSPTQPSTLEEEAQLIIALGELLTLVVLATVSGERWADSVVLYVGDNTNVQGWVYVRKSSNPVARFLLLLLSALEAVGRFVVRSAYLRAYHNVTADDLTQMAQAAIEDIHVKYGLQRVDAREHWAGVLDRSWTRRAFVWAGQSRAEREVALRLRERRIERPAPREPRSPQPGAGLAVVETGATSLQPCIAAIRLGGASICCSVQRAWGSAA